MDFLGKTLIGEYSYTDANKDRSAVKRVIIDGRKYFKTGVHTATTVVAFQYKVFNPSINRSEYITLMGVARQHAGDTKISLEEGYEIASENAMIAPVATFKFPAECSAETIHYMMKLYVEGLPIVFVKTQDELQKNRNDISIYSRKNNYNNNEKEYSKYYNDFKKLDYVKKYKNINNKL